MSNKSTKTQKPTELKDTELDDVAGGWSWGATNDGVVKKPIDKGDGIDSYMKIEMEK